MVLLLSLLFACVESWSPLDLDGDGVTPEQGDCDDLNARVYPAADESWYDGVDQNCDGNDADIDGDGQVPDSYVVAHANWERFEAHIAPGDCWDDPADATLLASYVAVEVGGVLADAPTAATTYTGADDIWYDGVDQDCGGQDDFDQDGDGQRSAYYPDADGAVGADCYEGAERDLPFTDEDGAPIDPATLGFEPSQIYFDAAATDACYDGIDANCDQADDYDCDEDGYDYRNDCDDEDPTRFPDPSVTPIWYNGIDEVCDGNDGDQDSDGYVGDEATLYYDSHGIDWADFSAHRDIGDCWDDPERPPPGMLPALNGYPEPEVEDVHPGAPETWYDGADQDCDGASDFDADGDGVDALGWVRRDGNQGRDCDDNDPAVSPLASETCATAWDDDCDGDTNELNALACTTFYADIDGDGYAGSDSACLCQADSTYLYTSATDCNDTSDEIHPGAIEICGADDDDCDGSVDEGPPPSQTWYYDGDEDGYGTTSSTVYSCSRPSGYVLESTDCDDNDPTSYPLATEIVANNVDNDCDAYELCYEDNDNDTYGSTTEIPSTDLNCYGAGESYVNTDCDDNDSAVSPSNAEIFGNGVDDDCDGTID